MPVSTNETSAEVIDGISCVIKPGSRDQELPPLSIEPELCAAQESKPLTQGAKNQRNEAPTRLEMVATVIANMKREAGSEVEFLQSQKEQAVGRLAGGIAHKFNNILTIIVGNCDLLLMELEEGGDSAERTDEIKKAAEKGVNMTRQLLACCGKQVPQPAVLDLNSIVLGMESMLEPLIDGQLRFETVFDPDLANVLADPSQIKYVLTNLIVNALDAMPNGGRLTIRTRNISVEKELTEGQINENAGDCVEISISDTGHGIPQDLHNSLFEPFFTTKEKDEGTGLSLATCHGIVKQTGGHISFATEVGIGTTFKVILPRAQDEAVA